MAMIQDEHWMEAQRKRIKEAFALFDKDKKGTRNMIVSLTGKDFGATGNGLSRDNAIALTRLVRTHFAGSVVQEEISTIMRYLGAYPSEKAMTQEILPDMQGDDVTAAVTYASFETKMLEILASRAWDPDPPEVLLRAFRAIDEKGCGFIETAKMNELLVSKGTPFRAKEIEAFLSVAKDTETGHIYFEDYVASLTTDG